MLNSSQDEQLAFYCITFKVFELISCYNLSPQAQNYDLYVHMLYKLFNTAFPNRVVETHLV